VNPAAEADVPAFARSFPEEPRLDALVQAFVQGDYARVRREGPVLAKTAEKDEVKSAALELVRRTKADPLMVLLLLLTSLLLGFLSLYWMARGGHVGR
jgi:hypothetical protein